MDAPIQPVGYANSATLDFPALSPGDIESLAGDIDRNGYAVVTDYLSDDDIAALRTFVSDAVDAAGNTYVMFSGSDSVAGTALQRLALSPAFKNLCMSIVEHATGRRPPEEPYYQILRCLTGEAGERHSMRFHYDTYVLTALFPIHVPAGKRSGELIVVPNFRGVRSNYATNLFDKVLLDNPLTQKFLRRLSERGSTRLVRIPMKPGNLYFFWGYRSIHTNAPCDPDQIRATALYHYLDPHRSSRLKRMLGR